MPRRMDARTLEPSALHLLRRQVVQAVRGGMLQTDGRAHIQGEPAGGQYVEAARPGRRPARAHAQAPGPTPR